MKKDLEIIIVIILAITALLGLRTYMKYMGKEEDQRRTETVFIAEETNLSSEEENLTDEEPETFVPLDFEGGDDLIIEIPEGQGAGGW